MVVLHSTCRKPIIHVIMQIYEPAVPFQRKRPSKKYDNESSSLQTEQTEGYAENLPSQLGEGLHNLSNII